MNNMNINQLNKAREKLISYEHKRERLEGLDDLNEGMEILVEYIEYINNTDDIIAKNMLITYQRNSLEWVKETLKNCNGYESEMSTLIYLQKLMDTFEDTNKLIDSGSELNHLQQSIKLS